MAIQIETIVADEQQVTIAAAEMYNGLVESGEDPIDAAWLVDEHFGFTNNGRHHRRKLGRDPFAPDYEALGRERDRGDWWDAAEHPAVQ